MGRSGGVSGRLRGGLEGRAVCLRGKVQVMMSKGAWLRPMREACEAAVGCAIAQISVWPSCFYSKA